MIIEISENATNGDVIKAIFPSIVNSNMDLVDTFNNAKEWWNAPYNPQNICDTNPFNDNRFDG